MSELGPVTIGDRSGEVFLGAALQQLDSVGNVTLEHTDAEIRRIVEEASGRAQAVLRAHWDVHGRIVDGLLSKETLDGQELAELLADVGVPQAAGA